MSFNKAKNIGFAILLFILVLVGLVPSISNYSIRDYNADFYRRVHQLEHASNIQKLFWEASLGFSEILNGSSDDFDIVLQKLNDSKTILGHLEEDLTDKNQKLGLKSVKEMKKSIKGLLISFVHYKNEFEEDPAADNTVQMEAIAIHSQKKANEAFTFFYDTMVSEVIENQNSISFAFRTNQVLSLIGLLLGLSAGIIAAIYAGRAIKRPIQNLLDGIKKIASGDLSFRIDADDSDEIGQLAAAFNQMSGKLESNLEKQKDLTKIAVDAAESEKQKSEELSKTIDRLNAEINARELIQGEMELAKLNAEKANQAKSDFLANMSHELRTPLNHIIGFTDLVLDQNYGELNETQSDYLTDVKNSSYHLLSLINDILDISKVEAGKHELLPATVELRELLVNSLNMVKEKSMKAGIKLSHDLNGIPDTIIADERKLKQVMYNLLSNAVKFTPNKGEINICAEACDICNSGDEITGPTKKGIQVKVSDTGIGLDTENIRRIFSPFEQVESSISRKYQGTGLGLALTKNFVELHGGKIWVESEGKNKGSNFHFNIPIAPAQE